MSRRLDYSVIEELADIDIQVAETLRSMALIDHHVKQLQWRRDPVTWARERLKVHLWSGQQRILNALRDYRRVAVATCHEVGKSFVSSLASAFWIDTSPVGEAFVLTTAPTGAQVRSILWRELNRLHGRGLDGRMNQTEWWLTDPVTGNEEMVAVGRKPDDYNPTAFHGYHARRLLFIFDEASSAKPQVMDSADSICANDTSKILLIGNPDDPTAEFEKACRPGSGYHVIHIGAFDTPIFTGEDVPVALGEMLIGRSYVEEKRKKWAPRWRWVDKSGEECGPLEGSAVVPPAGLPEREIEHTASPFWFSKILGRFSPVALEGGLIPISWLARATERFLNLESDQLLDKARDGRKSLGVDVGGGGDASTICLSEGRVAGIIHEDHNPDTMHTAAIVIDKNKEHKPEIINIDPIGIGQGVHDRCYEVGLPIQGVNVGAGAYHPDEFMQLRAEVYWDLRGEFENDIIVIDPTDEDSVAELASIRFMRQGKNVIRIETKAEAKRRGVPSPNRADAFALSRFKGPYKAGFYGLST